MGTIIDTCRALGSAEDAKGEQVLPLSMECHVRAASTDAEGRIDAESFGTSKGIFHVHRDLVLD